MSNYVSQMFGSAAEFEAWLKSGEHENKEALDCLTLERENEWDKKGCLLEVKDGKLQLLCKNKDVLAEIDICHADGETVIRDNETGAITVKGIKDKNSGKTFSVWIGTTEAFKNILVKDQNTAYFFTDDTTLDDLEAAITSLEDRVKSLEGSSSTGAGNISSLTARVTAIENGTKTVPKASQATSATKATSATSATRASYASTDTSKGTIDTRLDNLEENKNSTGEEITSLKGRATALEGKFSGDSAKKALTSDSATNADHATKADGADILKLQRTTISNIRADDEYSWSVELQNGFYFVMIDCENGIHYSMFLYVGEGSDISYSSCVNYIEARIYLVYDASTNTLTCKNNNNINKSITGFIRMFHIADLTEY